MHQIVHIPRLCLLLFSLADGDSNGNIKLNGTTGYGCNEKSGHIESLKSSKNVVKANVFYYSCGALRQGVANVHFSYHSTAEGFCQQKKQALRRMPAHRCYQVIKSITLFQWFDLYAAMRFATLSLMLL